MSDSQAAGRIYTALMTLSPYKGPESNRRPALALTLPIGILGRNPFEHLETGRVYLSYRICDLLPQRFGNL